MSIRDFTLYYNINSGKAYDAATNEISDNNRPFIFYSESINVTLQYLNSDTKDEDGAFTDFYTGFTGITITSSAAIDDNNIFYGETTLVTPLTAATPVSTITLATPDETPRKYGTLKLTNSSGETESVNYNNYQVSGGNYIFTTADADYETTDYTPTYNFAEDDVVLIKEPPLVKSTTIDDTDKDTGAFVITLDGYNAVLFEEINGESQLKDNVRFEHKIYESGNDYPSFVSQFYWLFKNLIDYDGDAPPAPNSDYYTITQSKAVFVEQDLTQYTVYTTFDGTEHIFARAGSASKYGTTLDLVQDIGDTLYLNVSNTTPYTPSLDYHPATKKYVDDIVGTLDLMQLKGSIDCSTNPDYPAANAGEAYAVSVAGKIGGASGADVTTNDFIVCLVDSSPSGDQATVGANWTILQANITAGNLTESTSSVLTITGGTGGTIGNVTIEVDQADTSNDGYLSSTDWNTFNNKAPTASPTFTGTVSISGLLDLTSTTYVWGSNGISMANNCGFYQSSLGFLRVRVEDLDCFTFTKNFFYVSTGPAFARQAISATVPGILPTYGDTASGLGWSSIGVWHLISSNTNVVTVKAGGIGILNGSPTAQLHIGAGTTVASTAPLKFTLSGAALLTTPEDGVLEPDSSGNLYFTVSGGTRKTIAFTDSSITIAERIRKAATELTISSGAITITQGTHTVDGESDLDDDLVTINGSTNGDILFLYPANSARDITIKHGTGNIITSDGTDYTIPDNGFVILLYDGSNWRLSSSGGSGGMIWQTISSATNAVTQHGYIMNVASSAFSLTLPGSPDDGDIVGFKSVNSTTYDATIDGNGNNIDGSATITLEDADGGILVYSSGTGEWHLITELASGTGAGGGSSSIDEATLFENIFIYS